MEWRVSTLLVQGTVRARLFEEVREVTSDGEAFVLCKHGTPRKDVARTGRSLSTGDS